MTIDPYRVLGVSPTADDTEIKEAYKKLVKQYHPDRYQDEDMKSLANEKMADINTAYDRITEDRRKGIGAYGASGFRGGYQNQSAQRDPRAQYRNTRYGGSQYGYAEYNNSNARRYQNVNIDYQGVRSMINSGRLYEADNILNSVYEQGRSAEWYYLKGLIFQKRGWLNDAYKYVAQATRMSGNPEYLATLGEMNRQRSGYMTGNANPATDNSSFTDIMCTICLLDACCDIDCCDCGDCI